MATSRRKKAPGPKAESKAKAEPKPAATAKERPEFLVVTLPKQAQEGSTLKLVHVAESFADAEAHVNDLPGTSERYFAVLEKKAVLRRVPVMQTSKAARNILEK